MGLRLFSSSCYDDCRRLSKSVYDCQSRSDNNPDPHNYRLQEFKEVGKYLVVKIRYPDCTNYEGNKILVFEGLTMNELLKFNTIDPHFSNSKTFKSPIARFVPTEEGWNMAVKLAEMMEGK